MGVFIAIILIFIAIGLFAAVQGKLISGETLGVLANIAGIVALLAAILVFVMPATQPKSSFSTPSPENTATTVLNSATPVPTESPTSRNAGNSTSSNWNGLLSVRTPTLNEIRVEIPISIWNANVIQVRDMYKPNTDSYTGEVRLGTEYLLPIYWCANNTDLLAQNMESIETQFFVNGEKIPNKYIFSYTYDTNTNWHCSYHAVVLGGWKKGSQYTLDIQRTLSTDLSDGQSNYSAGDYIYRLIVKVH